MNPGIKVFEVANNERMDNLPSNNPHKGGVESI